MKAFCCLSVRMLECWTDDHMHLQCYTGRAAFFDLRQVSESSDKQDRAFWSNALDCFFVPQLSKVGGR